MVCEYPNVCKLTPSNKASTTPPVMPKSTVAVLSSTVVTLQAAERTSVFAGK